MQIQRTSQVIIVVVIGLSLLAIGCALRSLYLRNLQQRAYETRIECMRMADQLAAGSDRLTAVVRAYAATGDRRWPLLQRLRIGSDRGPDPQQKDMGRFKKLAPDGNLVLRRGIWNFVGRTTVIPASFRPTRIPELPNARLETVFDANPKNMPNSQTG